MREGWGGWGGVGQDRQRGGWDGSVGLGESSGNEDVGGPPTPPPGGRVPHIAELGSQMRKRSNVPNEM